jgi:isobutyryl-CoA mutase
MSQIQTNPYKMKNKIRILSAASLFDGHDASINIMRRILQQSGAEVIHLGHNRSVQEVLVSAIQEDVHGIALTSYQGGHVEYFKYLFDLLKENNRVHVGIFGGGGGTILPSEIEDLHNYGISRIYSPDDGRSMGLQGMINDLLSRIDRDLSLEPQETYSIDPPYGGISRMITLLESEKPFPDSILTGFTSQNPKVLGITGTGGAGKSSLTDEIVRRFLQTYPDLKLAILSVDPTKKKTGGALLGDRIRMNSIYSPKVYMRSMATRESNQSISRYLHPTVEILKKSGFDLILIETAGIGQSDTQITELADLNIYVMTPEYGASTQLEKIDMIDYADLIAINKFDRKGALDALRDVKRQYQRSRLRFEEPWDQMPVYGTNASQFNDEGTNQFFKAITELLGKLDQKFIPRTSVSISNNKSIQILPPDRTRYLAEIVEEEEKRRAWEAGEIKLATELYQIKGVLAQFENDSETYHKLAQVYSEKESQISKSSLESIFKFSENVEYYKQEQYSYFVRGKEIKVSNFISSLSGTQIPKISVPQKKDWGEILSWIFKENFPGQYPYTSGVYPYKRTGEDPIRMFAGEGGPERTNKRFHYLSKDQTAIRLSTAFDSVTLYGEDPARRPDIYGKIGNSGVSIATLDDAKRLYSGFDLCSPSTSVSMTINGPAPMILAFFLNAAIDQECEKYILQNGLTEKVLKTKSEKYKNHNLPTYRGTLPETHDGLGLLLLGLTGDEVLDQDTYQRIKASAMSSVRGTVQADILKEDQAQNTCIFSTEFALKMMGDIQEYFIDNSIRNFYSVSISGYHMAEAGANPITQLAFTLANGFTFIEYYLSRGMHIDDFCPNFSFFFSNGLDPEYSVLGRVARKIWSRTVKNKYGGNERSQMLKYHIQTSGRSLHAQEIQFNDIRTTLQALYAIMDNCNSLHTNAYDEAITTPTEESVRRAVAIQLIINRELGLVKNENPLQGSFIIEELTELLEQKVLEEFKRISERGGVLGAMENMYQRHKIQDESLYYEHLKHSGQYPIIGVNTFLDSKGSPTTLPDAVIRSTTEEKEAQIQEIEIMHSFQSNHSEERISQLRQTAKAGKNVFSELMEVSKHLSLGQMTHALYEAGGQYRRNT